MACVGSNTTNSSGGGAFGIPNLKLEKKFTILLEEAIDCKTIKQSSSEGGEPYKFYDYVKSTAYIHVTGVVVTKLSYFLAKVCKTSCTIYRMQRGGIKTF